MKNIRFAQKFCILLLFGCVLMYASDASASVLGWITGKLFSSILSLIGFGSSENEYCWFCPLFSTIYGTINTLATNIAVQLKNVVLMTLGVGVLFFIAFRVGATVIKLQEVDLMQFLGELFKQLGRAIIAAAIIATTVEIFRYIVTPLLSYSLNLAITFMDQSSIKGKGLMGKIVKYMVGDLTSDAKSICHDFANIATADGTQAFSPDLLVALRCMLATVSANLVSGMVIGICVIATGVAANMILPDVQMVMSGGIIFGAFFMIYLKVPFVLIDNLIRLAFVAALMPFWVILWVFPATVQYTKNAWNMFLATCVSFVSFGVVIAIIMSILQYMCPSMGDILKSLMFGNDLVAASQSSVYTQSTLLTLALGIFCKQMLGVPDEFAARITQSYGISVGQGMEGQLTSAATRSLGMLGGVGAIGMGLTAAGSGALGEKEQKQAQETANMLSGGKSIVGDLFAPSAKAVDVSKYTQPQQQNAPAPSPTAKS